MDELEQRMSTLQLEAFVEAEQFLVTLRRKDRIKTSAGGVGYGPEYPVPPQPARLVPFKRRFSAIVVDTQYGDVPELQYVLVLPDPEANIRRDDWFSHNEATYDVKSIDPNRSVRTSAEVIYRATPDG